MNQANKLKDTLNLPSTDFPMRANAVEREPERLIHWNELEVYRRIQESKEGGSKFVLHDGPPFTNGDVHVGTALNKILKDTILRFKSACGFKTPYVPGWDCHGLPIEHKVSKSLHETDRTLDEISVRQACAEFSNSFIEKQKEQFKRLGVLADWQKEYRTMDAAYEAEILRTFAEFVRKGLVYRSKKPVYWSIPCKTALAEAEIEYKDHVSSSVFVRFKILNESSESYLVIWTTTPWTLPANLAIAVNSAESYSEVIHGGASYWVGTSLLANFVESCKFEDFSKGREISGKDMIGWVAMHPFIDRESPVFEADFVTMDSGTGCVHIAPGHGLDDYLLGKNYDLRIYCPLDDNGCYLNDGEIPTELVGVPVLERGKSGGQSANTEVLKILRENGSLLACSDYNHQYPHCWRSKTPVIFRAMDQWFVSLDKDQLRHKCLEEVSKVSFTPNWGENRIKGFLESRPDWCISRQRSWGVPIPVFFDEENEALLDPDLIDFLAKKIEVDGTNSWFSLSESELLEGYELDDSWRGKKLRKGLDTLDVWIDSGCSHEAVLKRENDLSWPADLYLEGSDQHRGWFQSSLWTAMVSSENAPYKGILTHGFVVDGEGKKISKSDGKPHTADSYVRKYGADILRLWVCSEDFRRDIPISDEIIQQIVRAYRTIRNTIRFQLGNLHDFSFENDRLAMEDLNLMDRWVLAKTADLYDSVTKCYENYEFHSAVQLINRFCSGVLSSTYHDIVKDRLYTLHPCDPKRRASQTAIHMVFEVFVRLLEPLIPFTADEAWSFHKEGKALSDSLLCLEKWPSYATSWKDDNLVDQADRILALKESKINDVLEDLREKKIIGQSLDAEISISLSKDDPMFEVLNGNFSELPDIFIVSSVVLENGEDGSSIEVGASHAPGVRCPRSWRWVKELVNVEPWGGVSPRCAEVLQKI